MTETQFYILLTAVAVLIFMAAVIFAQGLGRNRNDALNKLAGDMAARFDEAKGRFDGQSNEANSLRAEVRGQHQELGGKVEKNLAAVREKLAEMQSLTSDIGDLKRVLTNVKTRGVWGEMQLETLLSEILTADQYEKNVRVKPDSGERVEFAVKLPGQSGEDSAPVYLPIDSKFPMDAHERLITAAESADAQALETAAKELEARIRKNAKDISEKYIAPPHTTDFAIMYLPTESLFAEAVRRPGLESALQSRVVITGPTTFAALLNSLQVGFSTLAVEKRSSEIRVILEEVRTEFGKFRTAVGAVKSKLAETGKKFDELDRRTRVMDKKLANADKDAPLSFDEDADGDEDSGENAA